MAIGRMGMKLDDVRRLTFGEFEAIVDEWNKARETEYQDNWERMRMLATIVIQPHTKKPIPPKTLLPFPWEAKHRTGISQPLLTKDECKARFIKMMKKRSGYE